MKTKFLFVFAFFILIFSCKKENAEVSCESPFSNSYIPMSVGSYWIYEWYKVDTFGNETLMDWIDTIRIVKDTVIREQIFFVHEDENNIRNFYRDSLGYLVNSEGDIFFSSTNFTDTLHRTRNLFFEIYYLMETGVSEITTDAGSFECLNYQGAVTSLIINVSWSERKINARYAKGVGKIQSSTFDFAFNSSDERQRRLIEYHIE